MNWRGTAGLFVILAVLATAYFGMQWRGEEQAQQVETAKQLFDFAPAAVKQLSIRQVDKKAVAATRADDGTWTITEPNATIPPFAPLWDRVAEHLAGLTNERTLDSGALNLADYGLDVPALEVNADAGDRKIVLSFGKLEPTQEKRYALMDGKLLFLVDKNEFFELNRSLDDLRNKFTVDDREANILRLEFAQIWTGEQKSDMANPPMIGQESPPIIAARESAEAPWKLVAPREAAANQEIIGAIVKELQFAVGRQFIDDVESLSNYGLQPARMRITMVDDKGGRAQTFLFGATDAESKGIYVRRPDRDGVFVLDPQIVTLLPRTPDDFQERRLLTQQALDFDRIVVTHRGESCELKDEPEKGWRVQSSETFETDQAAISVYIAALKRVAGEKILLSTPVQVGLAEPETLIQLFPRGGGEPAQIRLQSKWEDPAFAVAQQDLGAIMTIPREMADRLQVDPMYFRSRKIWRVDPATVQEVSMTFEGQPYTFKRAHGVWAAVAPENLLIGDGAAMDAYIKTLAEIRVITPRPEAAVPEEALGFSPATLSVTLATGTEGEALQSVGPLDIGAATAEKMMQRYMRLAGQPGIYRVDQALIDATREFTGALKARLP